MKTVMFFLIVLLTAGLKAQTDSLTVNELKQKKLLELSLVKANQTIGTGKALVIGGFGLSILTYALSSDVAGEVTPAVISGVCSLAGLIGIPVWISGVSRKNDIQIQLVRYGYTGELGLGVKIKF